MDITILTALSTRILPPNLTKLISDVPSPHLTEILIKTHRKLLFAALLRTPEKCAWVTLPLFKNHGSGLWIRYNGGRGGLPIIFIV